MEKLGLVAAAVAQGLQEEEIEGSGVAVLAVDLEVEELLAVVVGVEEEDCPCWASRPDCTSAPTLQEQSSSFKMQRKRAAC